MTWSLSSSIPNRGFPPGIWTVILPVCLIRVTGWKRDFRLTSWNLKAVISTAADVQNVLFVHLKLSGPSYIAFHFCVSAQNVSSSSLCYFSPDDDWMKLKYKLKYKYAGCQKENLKPKCDFRKEKMIRTGTTFSWHWYYSASTTSCNCIHYDVGEDPVIQIWEEIVVLSAADTVCKIISDRSLDCWKENGKTLKKCKMIQPLVAQWLQLCNARDLPLTNVHPFSGITAVFLSLGSLPAHAPRLLKQYVFLHVFGTAHSFGLSFLLFHHNFITFSF